MAPPEISMKIRFENLFVSDSLADTVPDMYRDHPTFDATLVREDTATQIYSNKCARACPRPHSQKLY